MKTLILSLLLSSSAVSQADSVYELDFNEDRAMWRGKDYDINNPVIPSITKVENSKDCKSARGLMYVFVGNDKDNHCDYIPTTLAILKRIHAEYCDLAINDRGGDLDIELAIEQGCFNHKIKF